MPGLLNNLKLWSSCEVMNVLNYVLVRLGSGSIDTNWGRGAILNPIWGENLKKNASRNSPLK